MKKNSNLIKKIVNGDLKILKRKKKNFNQLV